MQMHNVHQPFIRTCTVLILCLICLCMTCTKAESPKIDLRTFAEGSLTEVLGYTQEEANHFTIEQVSDDLVRFWPEDHPDWVYTLFVNEARSVTVKSPFDVDYTYFRGESLIRKILRHVHEQRLFHPWNSDSLQKLLQILKESNIHVTNEILLSEDAGNVLHGLFESLFGPDLKWTVPLRQLYQSILEEEQLEATPLSFHTPGIRQVTYPDRSTLAIHTLTLFENEVPEFLKFVFSDPYLDGWTCKSGAVREDDWSAISNRLAREEHIGGVGIAAFEKDGKRRLMQVEKVHDAWALWPIGDNALYEEPDYRISYSCLHEHFAIEYLNGDGSISAFYVHPDAEGHYCSILYYEYLNPDSQECVLLTCQGNERPMWSTETLLDTARPFSPLVLGTFSMQECLPEGSSDSTLPDLPTLPAGYASTPGVQFRTGTSTRSRSHGQLLSGTLFPVLDRVPGESDEWIHTKLGFLEGYISSNYANDEDHSMSVYVPQPLAKAVKEIRLRKGTRLFASSVGTFPAGTKMHVVMDLGNWLYVSIPGGGITWHMDPEGTFGFVRKKDVVTAYTEAALDWIN